VNPTLRTTWAMLNAQTLAAIALAVVVLVRFQENPRLYTIFVNMLLWTGLVIFGGHVSRVLEAGIWRTLPGGRRIATRALGLIVAALSVIFGALFHWAAPAFFADLPLGMTLQIFINLSVFAFLLLLGMGRQLPRLFVVVYMILFGVALIFTSVLFRDVPAFWYGATAACAALWMYASLADLRAPHYSRRRFAWDVGIGTLLARADRGLSIGVSPARVMLRAGRAGLGPILIASCAFVLVAFSQHITMGRLPTVPLAMFLFVPFAGVAIFAAHHALRFAAPAKRLWLCWAESRAGVFRLVERMAIQDIGIVSTAAWTAVTGFALLRGVEIAPLDALKMWVACLGVAVTFVYVGLLYSTVHVWWAKVLLFAAGAIGVAHLSNWWLIAFGTSHLGFPGEPPTQLALSMYFALALLALAVLRFAAAARWKRIDWSHYRSKR